MQALKSFGAVVLCLAGLLLAPGRAQAEPALWVVKGPHATIYLFGSVHVLKKDEPWRSAKIDAAIQRSGSLWLEVTDVDDPKAMQPLVMKLGVDQTHPLSTLLTKDQLAKLDAAAKSAGIPSGEAAFEPFRPWLAAISLSMVPITQAGFDPKSGVELTLKPEFQNAGKSIHGFETSEQQMHMLADMPQQTQLDYLNSGVEHFAEAPQKFKQLVAAWYAGDEKTLDEIFDAEFRSRYPAVYQALVVKRNEAFARQIADLTQGDGTVFAAVGAAHLVGPDGVPAMLAKLGYKVERQ